MFESYKAFNTICSNRKSYRQFSEKPVSDDLIKKILDSASTSPFASGRKNWKVLVINSEREKKMMLEAVDREIEKIAAAIEPDMSGIFLRYANNFRQFAKAPTLLLPIFRVTPVMRSLLRNKITPAVREWERDNSVKSISCVAMIILLAAESLNLAACYMTGPLLANDELAKIAKLPSEYEIGAVIPVGHHSEK